MIMQNEPESLLRGNFSLQLVSNGLSARALLNSPGGQAFAPPGGKWRCAYVGSKFWCA